MIKFRAFLLVLPFIFSSCSNSSNNSTTPSQTQSQYAMTAKINGVTFQANSIYGNNTFAPTNIWSYFPIADYVMLQGRQGGALGNPEIDIWLKRSDIVVGTYTIGTETFSTPPSHFIDLNDLTSADSQYTKNGTITITAVNTAAKTVTGTFSFTCVASPNSSSSPINGTVTDGTFNFIYSN